LGGESKFVGARRGGGAAVDGNLNKVSYRAKVKEKTGEKNEIGADVSADKVLSMGRARALWENVEK